MKSIVIAKNISSSFALTTYEVRVPKNWVKGFTSQTSLILNDKDSVTPKRVGFLEVTMKKFKRNFF